MDSTSNQQLLEIPPERLQVSSTHPLTVDGFWRKLIKLTKHIQKRQRKLHPLSNG